MTMITYPKMNKEIKVLLGSDKYNPTNLYALARIEELEGVLEGALHYIEIGQYNATNEQVYINEIRAALAKGDTDDN